MKQLDKEEQQLLDLLPKGIERPRPLKELVKLSGLKDREVRGIIYRLIVLHHVPIGAQYNRPNGYYIITNDKERQQALAPLTSQITMMSKRAEIISNAELESEE
ncbi:MULTISPECIES: hypothetical protein [Lactobacillaceae]|uniref:hypothetical protein n=1 Tax=Lactobacillaceae TaxID=33958 RepID=UPI000A2E884D|nr:hypothetical protein [Limosilactobacillus reuteri]OTA86080.1 hypothetical protein BHL84_01575 [Limosilactobacillus reuteri]